MTIDAETVVADREALEQSGQEKEDASARLGVAIAGLVVAGAVAVAAMRGAKVPIGLVAALGIIGAAFAAQGDRNADSGAVLQDAGRRYAAADEDYANEVDRAVDATPAG